MTSSDYLNIGCGNRFHPDWVNIDLTPSHPSIRAWDITGGLPFPDASFKAVYHSHLLEHLDPQSGKTLLRECARVLKPGGVVRVAVPDLEQIVSSYLKALHDAVEGIPEAADRHEWMLLELYDQMVRTSSGGRMIRYLEDVDPRSAKEVFVTARCGVEIADLLNIIRQRRCGTGRSGSVRKRSRWSGASFFSLNRLLSSAREKLLCYLLGEEYGELQVARFRRRGEIHQWMYDRFSLRTALEACGFYDIVKREAHTSTIDDWATFNLDTEADGTVYKPDSMFMEGVR